VRISRITLTAILALCTASAFSAKPPAQAPRGSNSVPATEERDSPQRVEPQAELQQETEVAEVAFKYWLNTDASGAWNAANWGGSLPADGDRLIISGRYSNADIHTGLDRTGDTGGAGLYLDAIEVEEDYQGNIGADGNPLTLSCKDIVYKGSGSAWFHGAGTSAVPGIHTIAIDSPNLQDAVRLTNAAGVGYWWVSVSRGHVVFDGTINATFGDRVILVERPGARAFLDVLYNATTLAKLDIIAGQATVARRVTALNQYGGTCTTNLLASGTTIVDTLAVSGGYHIHNGKTGAGQIGTLRTIGGVVDLTQTRDPKTIGVWEKYPNGILQRRSIALDTISVEYNFLGDEIDQSN